VQIEIARKEEIWNAEGVECRESDELYAQNDLVVHARKCKGEKEFENGETFACAVAREIGRDAGGAVGEHIANEREIEEEGREAIAVEVDEEEGGGRRREGETEAH